MSNYYYIKDNVVCEPVDRGTLKYLRDTRRLSNDDKACKEGTQEWIPVKKIIENDPMIKILWSLIPLIILIFVTFFIYSENSLKKEKQLSDQKYKIDQLERGLRKSSSIIESAFIKLEIRDAEARLEKLERGIWDKDYLVPFLLLLIIGSQAVLFIFIVKTKKEILLLKKNEGVTGNSGSTP